jgi:hypothetical protein
MNHKRPNTRLQLTPLRVERDRGFFETTLSLMAIPV